MTLVKFSRLEYWHPTPVLLPGKSHGWRSLEGCSPWGRWGYDTTERLHFHFSLSCIGEGNGQPTPVFLPGESQGWGSLVGCRLWGRTESDKTEVTWQQQQQNTGVGSLSFLQGIFPTQGSNQGLPHCRQILYQLSHKGSPRILEWVAYPFSSGSSRSRNQTGVSWIPGRLFTSWATREAPKL